MGKIENFLFFQKKQQLFIFLEIFLVVCLPSIYTILGKRDSIVLQKKEIKRVANRQTPKMFWETDKVKLLSTKLNRNQ